MSGRGRGRPGGGGLKGATWEHDASIKLETKPMDLFPPHPNLKKAKDLTEREKNQIRHYKEVQKRVHRGSLYTQPTKRNPDDPAKTFSEDQFNRQYGSNRKADFDPFTGVETYSQRFQPKKNEIPSFKDVAFNKELFPEELWSTLEGEEGEEVRKQLDRATKKKKELLASMRGKKSPDKTQVLLDKINSIAGDLEEDEEVDDEPQDDAEVDSTFDDESMGGDYNGEKYFDNGEDGSEGEEGGNDDDY